jgi:hypothetical protein
MSRRSHHSIRVNVEGLGAAEISVSATVVDVADMIHKDLAVCPHVVAVLKRVLAKYPNLSFGQFVTAMRLVELATRGEPGGRA